MSQRITMSRQTRTNWLIDAAVFVGALLSMLSGIYFLFIPSGGYQGGRNPMYGVQVFFSRHTWDDVHTWGGVLMIAAVVVHLAMHWKWIKMTGKRIVNTMRSGGATIPQRVKINITINIVIGISFTLTAVSGIYFLFAPSGGFQGGNNPLPLRSGDYSPNWDPGFLFSRTTWDLIHTWSGVVMIVAAVIHFAIHWHWVKNVTKRFFLSLWQRPRLEKVPAVQKARM
jgi:preprotein translocase subunit SecY